MAVVSDSALPAGDGSPTPDLFTEVLAEKPQAFRAFFRQYAPAIQRFCRDLLRDPSAAEEAVQETFVRTHRKLSSVQDPSRLAAFCFGIARMVCLEQLRRSRRRARTHQGQDACLLTADNSPSPEQAVLGQEAEAQLAAALGRIAPKRRAALLLRIDHGFAYRDIATQMGWSLAKVKNEVHRARLELRADLASYLGGTT